MSSTNGKINDHDIVSAFPFWKQVEFNTIASGFGHLGPASRAIQRCTFLLQIIAFLLNILFSYNLFMIRVYINTA